MTTTNPSRNASGKFQLNSLNAEPVLTCDRDYAATYWPNKGIKGRELQNIHGKIVASDNKLAGEGSPNDDSNNVDNRASPRR